jgi:uncharacterized membrane protein
MMQTVRHYWENIRTSYWFLPSLMTALAAGLALGVVRLDESVREHWILELDWIYTGSAEGARQLLATVAGSMVTVAGVVFSVTVVALSLASNQFGPRLLRNFMRDRGNQLVLGTFIATFVYCLLVLRTVRGENGGEFVPHIAVSGAVFLALASVGVLIYFIHHASVSVQAPVIIANVGRELNAAIDELFPEELGENLDGNDARDYDADIPADFDAKARAITAKRDGYIQLINNERLLEVAEKNDLLIRIAHRPGHFVVRGELLARASPIHRADGKGAVESIRDTFVIGSQQTQMQDAEFVINQLVEVAVRALSPGVNDPFTAATCVDFLVAALCRLAERKIPSPYRLDSNGRLRVVAYSSTFASVADTAFRQIRQHGGDSVAVIIRMMDGLGMVVKHARRRDDRAALLRHARLLKQCIDAWPEQADRDDAIRHYQRILEASQPHKTSDG